MEDSLCLQTDLHTIYSWANKWQMKLNIDKCVVPRCTRSLSPLQFVCKVNDKTFKVNEQHRYLLFTNVCNGHIIISSMCSTADRSLNFLHRNLSKCSRDVKENAYITITRPTLEYAACTWDPYQEYLVYDTEKIQRCTARWILFDHIIVHQLMPSVLYLANTVSN